MRRLCCIVLALFSVVPAFAVTFAFTFTTASTQADIDAFTEAGAFWSSNFSDDITLNMNVGTDALASGVLAQAGSTKALIPYSDFRSTLTADSTTVADAAAVSSLSAGNSFGMLINNTSDNPNGSGSGVVYLDDNGSANNSNIRINSANAKALGYSYGGSDATITFSNNFTWDYDSSDGIASGAFDFVGIAIHEIGHALGFVSGVDILDGNSPPDNGPFPSDAFTYVSPLDLFRYSSDSAAQSVIDWTAGGTDKYFSLDGGTTEIAEFSTGKTHGDGQQASHWKDELSLGIMDPTVAPGVTLTATENDFLALDAIGYDRVVVIVSVPEPSSMILSALGSLLLLCRRRRHQH